MEAEYQLTAEEAEKLSKSGLIAYYTNMLPNVILGAGLMIGAIIINQ